uniref:Uncharacterized protein AlNc14C64G4570 n=1 Tax=Albugo laibachii Nc14 TaxID=890382 RepID=F0WD49_9STRA|nr:conserved hypothetical protein [Albugo laibachii Nc14]|eukprot:CCA19121.1 conserved hypothetical protein [Albugo laibachii Nc14]
MLFGTSILSSFPSFSIFLALVLGLLAALVYYRTAQNNTNKPPIPTETSPLGIRSDGIEKERLPSQQLGSSQSRGSPSQTLRILNLTHPALTQNHKDISSLQSLEAPINPSEPYAFENEFVYGKLMFFLVQEKESMAPYIQRLFQGKRRLFWIQLQIRFKKVPSGPLFIGGEVPHSMNLGFFTQGLARLILRILNSLLSGLHYGFGAFYKTDPKVTHPNDEELPHIVFPLYTSVDQFVCTSNTQTPPSLGTLDFGESKKDALTRRKSNDIFYAYQTNCTYSFHFHSYFIDFHRWKLVNVPGIRETPLQAFWSDMPLRLVAYTLNHIDTTLTLEKALKNTPHTLARKEYHFSFALVHSSKPQSPSVDLRRSSENSRRSSEDSSQSSDHLRRYSVSLRTPSESGSSDSIEEGVFIPQEISVPVWLEYVTELPGGTPVMDRWVGYVLWIEGRTGTPSSPQYIFCSALEAFEPLRSMETQLRANGNRRFMREASESSCKAFKGLNSVSVYSCRRKYKQIEEEREFLQHKLREILHSKEKHSDQRKAKRALYSLIKRSGQNAFAFLQKETVDGVEIDEPGAEHLQKPRVLVLRAVKRTFWRMEWMGINPKAGSLEFFRKIGVDGSSWSIPLTQVFELRVEEMRGTCDSPQMEIKWMRIVTLEMCHHVGFPSEASRSIWLERILLEMEHNEKAGGSSMEKRLYRSIDSVSKMVDIERFVQPLAPRSCGVRRAVLNDRSNFSLYSKLLVEAISTDALDLLAGLIDRITALYSIRCQKRSIVKLFEFLDALEALQTISLRQRIGSMAPIPRENFKKTWFLNLFHLLILHASLFHSFIPKILKQWSRFFNGISYCVDGIYFSLAEIEHCIIRAPMSSPRIPVVKLMLPRKLFGCREDRALIVDTAEFALKTPDFRLNFALNCMTRSSLNCILVYSMDQLDAQLSMITRDALTVMISYDYDRKTVFLPRVCDWYRYDFAMDGNPRTMIFQCFLPYLEGDQKTLFQSLLIDERGRIARWKFAKYHFGFRDIVRIKASAKETVVTLGCTNENGGKLHVKI